MFRKPSTTTCPPSACHRRNKAQSLKATASKQPVLNADRSGEGVLQLRVFSVERWAEPRRGTGGGGGAVKLTETLNSSGGLKFRYQTYVSVAEVQLRLLLQEVVVVLQQ